MKPLQFLKAAGALGIGSIGLAIGLLTVSIIEHVKDKNVAGYSFLVIAFVLLAFGPYLACSAENAKWKDEVARNERPSLQIELFASFFDVSQVPGTHDSQIHIYAYLRVTNLSQSETLITGGRVNLTVGGVQYSAKGDDISRRGDYIEHNSILRLGGSQ